MSIQLTTKLSETKDGLYAYALHVSAKSLLLEGTEGSEAAAPIFVFRRSTPTMNPGGQTDREVDDEFFNVATPVDMYDIPEGEPDIANGMPYYRDSHLELWFRNLEDALRAKDEIRRDVASLAKLWDNISDEETFKQEETEVYP